LARYPYNKPEHPQQEREIPTESDLTSKAKIAIVTGGSRGLGRKYLVNNKIHRIYSISASI
jgi:hypothetical protein